MVSKSSSRKIHCDYKCAIKKSNVLQKECTLLMCGARGGSAGVVNYLAEALESLNGEAIDSTGGTAIHHAATAGHPSTITALSNIPGIKLETKDEVKKSIIFYIFH